MKLVGDRFKTGKVLLELTAAGLQRQTLSEGSKLNYTNSWTASRL